MCAPSLVGLGWFFFGGGGEGEVGRRGRRSRSPPPPGRRPLSPGHRCPLLAPTRHLGSPRVARANFWMWQCGVGAGNPPRRGTRGGRKAGFPLITQLTHTQVAQGGRRVSKAKTAVILRKQLFTLSPAAGDRAQPSPPPRPPAFPAGAGCAAVLHRGRQVMGEILH